MKNGILLVLSFFFLAHCENASTNDAVSMGESMDMEPPRTAEASAPPPMESDFYEAPQNANETQGNTQVGEATETIGKKVIKDGRLSVEVEDLNTTKKQVDTLLKGVTAYYENEDFNASSYRSTYTLKIRIPAENFEKLLTAVEATQGEVVSKTINARDVTEEYVDLSIRLENNRQYLKRYNELLARANSVEDMLEIQERTRRLEEEIDAKLGRLKFIDDQVRYSTLYLELIQHHEIAEEREKRNYGKKALNALVGGFDLFLNFLLFILNLWPFLLLLALLWIFRKRLKFTPKKQKNELK